MATVQYPPFLPLPQRADQNMTQDTAADDADGSRSIDNHADHYGPLKATWTLQWIFTLARG